MSEDKFVVTSADHLLDIVEQYKLKKFYMAPSRKRLAADKVECDLEKLAILAEAIPSYNMTVYVLDEWTAYAIVWATEENARQVQQAVIIHQARKTIKEWEEQDERR